MSLKVELFKNLMSCWATGVSIVSSIDACGQLVGMTANSFTSVSLNPPLILCCLQKNARTTQVVLSSKILAISILNHNQRNLSRLFASDVDKKFINVQYQLTPQLKCPIIIDTCGWIECKIKYEYEGGDHIIIVAEVLNAQVNEHIVSKFSPLLYHRRSYKTL